MNRPHELPDGEECPSDDAAHDEAWFAEIQRRRRLLDAGEMPLIPWSEVRARLLAGEP